MNDTRQRLSRTTVALHWIVSIAVIGMWIVGYYIASSRSRTLLPWHKSVGMVLFAFVLVRVAWRIRNGWLQPVSVYSQIEQRLAKIVHWTLLIAILVMPLSGIVSTYTGGREISLFGWQIIPDNVNHAVIDLNPTGRVKVTPRSEVLHDFFDEMHTVVAWILATAVLLHVTGALKHHLIDKDGTLRRMLGANVE